MKNKDLFEHSLIAIPLVNFSPFTEAAILRLFWTSDSFTHLRNCEPQRDFVYMAYVSQYLPILEIKGCLADSVERVTFVFSF